MTELKFVISRYRARWTGLVLNTRVIKKSTLCDVLIIKNSNGSVPRRRMIMTLNKGYLTPVLPVDISHINPDWLKIYRLQCSKCLTEIFRLNNQAGQCHRCDGGELKILN